MPLSLVLLSQVSILAYAALGGVFLAFSDFIMRALGTTDGGAAAMQSINREVFRIVFMTLFLGMVPVSLALTVTGWWHADAALAAAGLLYLLGSFAVTAAGNVPLNDRLAATDPASPDGAAFWRQVYVPRWTRLNTLRALACFGSAALALHAIT